MNLRKDHSYCFTFFMYYFSRTISTILLFFSNPTQPKKKKKLKKTNTIRNGGCLGSYNDEERSKLRNVMRIAELVNHQIFECKSHSRVILRVCLFECICLTIHIKRFARVRKGTSCCWAWFSDLCPCMYLNLFIYMCGRLKCSRVL